MTRTSLLVRRSAAPLFAAALLLTACGTSGGSDAAKDETTTTAAKTTTTADEETTTTTEATEDGPTADDLAALLPTVADVGEGWTEDTSERGDPSAIETATEQECPDAAALLAPAEDDEPTVAFTNDDGQSLRVTFSAGVDPLDPTLLQDTIDAVNDCDAVTAEENGLTYTASFDAAANDTYGDAGIQIRADINVTDGTDSVDATKYRLLFADGTVGVTISGGDGVLDDGTVNPIDTAGLDATAQEMANRVASL